MKSWLKFIGLSFFSDKIAKEARIRGVLNCVLGFVLSLVFIFCGVLAANGVPFYAHYNNSAHFQNFVHTTFEKVSVNLENSRASAENVINTYSSTADEAEYFKNGYNLIVDTRSGAAYDDFEAYCLSKDGKTEITYQNYLTLSQEDRGNYDFKIRYTPNVLVLTDELAAGYESYLSQSQNEDIKKQYAELTEKKTTLSTEEYRNKLYALYLKAYYPQTLSSYERAGVPLLRSYYYYNYLYKEDVQKCLFIFDDVLFGFFDTDGGIAVSFYGSYEKSPAGTVTAEGADDFLKAAFSASVPSSASVYLMNIFRLIPFIAAIPVILALLAMLVLTFIKDEKFKKFTTCLKIEFSFVAVGALFTALIHFICSFFVSAEILNSLPLIILAGVLAVRTLVFLAGEYFAVKKAAAAKAEEERQEKLGR